MKKVGLMVAVFALASCSTTPLNYAPETYELSFPEVGAETYASLGEDLLQQGIAVQTQGLVLRVENNINNFVLSPGFYPMIGEDDEWTYHSFQIGNSSNGLGVIRLTGGLFGQLSYPQSIKASKTERKTCVVVGGLAADNCDTEYGFTREERPILSDRNFQQTLIYTGRVGDRIRIGYRETSGNMARPAFSTEAEYDLSTSDEIAYRGARLRVIDADNEGIRYVVLSNFNTPRSGF